MVLLLLLLLRCMAPDTHTHRERDTMLTAAPGVSISTSRVGLSQLFRRCQFTEEFLEPIWGASCHRTLRLLKSHWNDGRLWLWSSDRCKSVQRGLRLFCMTSSELLFVEICVCTAAVRWCCIQGRLHGGKWTQVASSLAQGEEEFHPQGGGEFPQIYGS